MRTRSLSRRAQLSTRTSRLKTNETFSLTASITTENQKLARTISQAIAPETKLNPGYRSLTKLDFQGRELRLQIKARDLVALRAASNSFLRFIATSQKVIEVVVPFYRTRRVSRTNTT